ncbi:MAG: hypothetical protein GYA62_15310 [Bacteroidales bacterium]|nr:hypothetical protein [Bacteroidales bacterium]
MNYLYILSVLFLFFLVSKRKPKKPLKPVTDLELQNIFNKIKNKYGLELAKQVEKIARIETAHFKSGGYKNTYGFGALAFKNSFPYGWSESRVKNVSGIWKAPNNYTYLVFNSPESGLIFLADYLKAGNLKDRVQKWGSAPGYYENVQNIKNKFV